MSHAISDALVVTKRQWLQLIRVPEVLIFSTIQPVMFVLLFRYVFVTDGACMTSAACVNPSLTYMALTARAVDYAVKQLKNNNL